jgi:hypothetical protein
MLFLVLLIPLAFLGAVLAWMSWCARHRKVALAMVGISLVSSGLSIGIILACFYFYQTFQVAAAG